MRHRRSRGFTLIELLVVIAIIAILAAILFPVFARAKEKARQTSCLSNIKQIQLAVIMYTQDYDEYMPRSWFYLNNQQGWTWADVVLPYIRNDNIFDCPSTSRRIARSTSAIGTSVFSRNRMDYGANTSYWGGSNQGCTDQAYHPWFGTTNAECRDPAQTITMFDCNGSHARGAACDVWGGFINGNANVERHNDGINFAFYDGHAKWMRRTAAIETHLVGGLRIKYMFTREAD